jgi:hypothetical protein
LAGEDEAEAGAFRVALQGGEGQQSGINQDVSGGQELCHRRLLRDRTGGNRAIESIFGGLSSPVKMKNEYLDCFCQVCLLRSGEYAAAATTV